METLLEKSRINIPRLQRLVLKILSTDVNNLSRPCYFPPQRVPYISLLNEVGLKDKDIKEFAKRTYKGTIAQSFNIANEPGTNLLLFLMWYALKKRNKTLFYNLMIYHMVRQFGHLMDKHFKYCNDEVFTYSLETLTKTHLFSREKTIANSLFHLARELQKKYEGDIKNFNIDQIIQFISVSRHRVAQSVRSFAQHYYRSHNSGAAIKTYQDSLDDEGNQYQAQQLERGKKIVDAAVKKFTVFKTTDKLAVRHAIERSKIKPAIADIIVRQLNDMRYADNIRLILQLFIKDITDTSMLCGRNYDVYVKRLMAVKRTKSRIYFKQQINILLMKLLKDAGFMKTFLSYTTQTQFIIHSFLAFYLTMVVRHTAC